MNFYKLPEIKDTQIIKLYKEDDTFIVLSNANVLGGVCDCCSEIDIDEFVRFEVVDID